ncbi:MAG: hypothetical protein H7Z14_07445 [Anaerolineae bacterium]|nr:hypothetical protein [Phycisphaerae bacterium]
MSRRPFPVWPRGAGRRRARAEQIIVGVPRDCPMWKILAMRALFKPQLKDAIQHRRSTAQRWSHADRDAISNALNALRDRLESTGDSFPQIHFPGAGEYRMIATCMREQDELAKTIAILLSRHLPRRWIVVGKLMVRDERFYRRSGRFNLVLKSARDVHVRHDLRRIIGNRPNAKLSDPS